MSRKSKYVTDAKTFNEQYARVVQLRDELRAAKEQADELITKLNENLTLPDDVQSHIVSLKSELSTIQNSYANTTTYIEAIKTYKDNFDEVKDEIDSELTEATSQNESLKSHIKEVNDLKKQLTDENKRSKDLLDDARKTLQIVTDSSLSSVFLKRSNERKTARRLWAAGVVLSFSGVAYMINHVINNVAHDANLSSNIGTWILKFAISAPFIYFLYFVIKQYTHERDLEEKYAFKALISQTINNNTKLLKDEFSADSSAGSGNAKILTFTIDSMKSVYKEPFKDSSLKSKLKLNPKNTDVSAEIEQSETV